MEKNRRLSCRAAICAVVVLLSATAFSCSLAAEFHKVKEKEMKLDGSLCSLPRSSSFELGITAIACLSVAQLVGTTAAATTICAKPKASTVRGRVTSITLLVLSWMSFALAVILLATASSMNNGQRYGRGWLDGDCYVARNGVFGGGAALVVVTALLILGFTYATKSMTAAAAAAAASSTTARFRASADAEQPAYQSNSKQ